MRCPTCKNTHCLPIVKSWNKPAQKFERFLCIDCRHSFGVDIPSANVEVVDCRIDHKRNNIITTLLHPSGYMTTIESPVRIPLDTPTTLSDP